MHVRDMVITDTEQIELFDLYNSQMFRCHGKENTIWMLRLGSNTNHLQTFGG